VFTDRDIQQPDTDPTHWAMHLVSVFPVLRMMSQGQRDALTTRKPALLYEYLSLAASRTADGYPVFLTLRVVFAEDWPRLQAYLTEYKVGYTPLPVAPQPPVPHTNGRDT